MGGGRRQGIVHTQIGAENIVEGKQREETPANRQLTERRIGANGMPDVVGTAPARFVEPQRQHRTRSAWPIERRPEDRKRLPDLRPLQILAIDACRDPPLNGKRPVNKVTIVRRTALLYPVDQKRFTAAADRACAPSPRAKRHRKMPVTPDAAIPKQLTMG